MLIAGMRDFSIHEAGKKPPEPLFVMRTAAAAIIPEGGLVPSLYRTRIEREQLEMGKPMMRIGKKLLPLWSAPRRILRIANNIIINQ